MSNRSLAGSTVTLVREGTQGRTARTFRVLQEYRRGSTVICYTAQSEDGGPVGVLREFCPQDTDTRHYVLRRGTDHFLYTAGHLPAANENFCTSRDEYTDAYHRLSRSERLREDELLQSFIPSFEIYYSEAEHPGYNGTVYIWTDRLLKTFAELCEEIQKKPSSRPEYYLAVVLNAVCTLTECIRALHAAGFIHRDIKPSNFGFARREDKVLTQTLTLFDIDSIWNTEDTMGPVVGTEGYMAPETLKTEPDNRADIYSIGATLFSAIIITDRARENGFRYKAEFYDELEKMVDESTLIRVSEQNSHPRLRQLLAKILRGCLNADSKQRYRNCRHLIDDLTGALSYVLPPELALRSRAGERWVLTDEESSFDRARRRNSVRLFRYQMYERPLYRKVAPYEKDIRVLTLGLGNYGQRFIDVILSLCQLPGKQAAVWSLSADSSDLSLYLRDRPMLQEFISVNGAAVSEEKFCGSLHTITRRLELTKPNEETESSLSELLNEVRPHQIFLALGNENANLAGAKLCEKICREMGQTPEISFVWDEEICAELLPENVAPAYVNANTGKMAVHAEIERMAFNLYALQHRDEELGRSRLKKEFRSGREHETSIAQVVTIRYMLWSIGIDPSGCTAEKAAAAFVAMDRADPEFRAVLGQAEHRRRVMEKVCAGWTRMQRFPDDGSVKNERRKQHLCLVGSRVNEGLPQDMFLWEQAEERELQRLDELDRLSVQLHRYYLERANTIASEISENSTTEAVRRMIGSSGEASAAFHELCCCMQDIMAGDRDKARFYRGLCNAFLKTLQTLPDEKERNARRLFVEVQREFAPAAESARFRDLKKDAEQLADIIPYILTYTEPTLAVPFGTGNSTAIFSNVAAAIVAEPGKIFYLCSIRDAAADEFCQAVAAVLRILKRKHLQPRLELLIAYSCTGPNGWKESLTERLAKAAEGFLCKVRLLHIDEEQEMADAFTDMLAERRAHQGRLIVERNDSQVSRILEKAGFYVHRAMYRFDSLRMEFLDCRQSEWLRYIPADRCITAGDLISLGRETGSIEIQPQFVRSYRELWKRYRKDPAVWRSLCCVLAAAAEKYDTLVRISCPDGAAERKAYRYILPAECMAAAGKLLGLLRKAGIVTEGNVHNCDTLNGEASFLAPAASEDAMDELFGNPLLLLQKDDIFFRGEDSGNTIAVCLDHREVRNITHDEISAEQWALLEYFRDAGFVINLRKHNGKIAFTCATRQVKRLMTSAERILEIYTYRKLKETVGFDDVRAGIHLRSIGTDGEEQLDMAVSRGFRSMIVECRDLTRISPEYCAEFSRMAEQTGINSEAVLVVDECAGPLPPELTDSEDIPNVILITEEKDISDIGHVLLHLMLKN